MTSMTGGSPLGGSPLVAILGWLDDHHFCPIEFRLGHEGRVAVEVGVGEEAGGRTGVVDDGEPELAVVVPDPACPVR